MRDCGVELARLMEFVTWNPNQLAMGAVIHSDNPINNLCFHKNGHFLVGTTDSSVILVDCLAGKEKKRIYCKTNGIGKAAYTHHESCCIVSSDRKTNDIRYLCLHDNRYLRAFDGHTQRVTSLSMSPTDDHFLSSGDDGVVFLWDLSVSNPIGRLQLPAGHINVR